MTLSRLLRTVSAPRHLWLAIFVFAVGSPGATAQHSDRVDTLAEALLETARLPSLSIAILRDDEVAYARAFGYADIEGGIAATPATLYRCASVSKVITATAIARLVQEGSLDLDAPVTRYVPDWAGEPVITPRQLAGHLAGVSHYRGDDRMDRSRHYESVSEALEVFRDSPRSGAPGEAYTYSTHGFTLLSAVAEGASGHSFLQLLAEDVFAPLGMTETGPDMRADLPATMSTLYGRRLGEPVVVPRPEDPSYKWGAGGLISTPSDLVRLARGYLSGYLTADVTEEMWTSQRTNDGDETGVGIAWRIGRDHQGKRVIHHSGSMGGARSTIVIWPESGEAVAVMTNVGWNSDIMETGLLLMDAYRTPSGAGSARTSAVAAYDGEMVRNEEAAAATGDIELDEDGGWITMPEPFAVWTGRMAVDRMPIVHLSGANYALVSPFGLMPLEIRAEGEGLSGLLDRGSTRWAFQTETGGPR